MITKFNIFFLIFILILSSLSIFLIEKKKSYFQSIEVGNKIYRYTGANPFFNQVIEIDLNEYNLKFKDTVLNAKYDFIWDYDDTYLIYFFSSDLKEINNRVNNIEKKINKLNNKFQKEFTNSQQSIDYINFKAAFLIKENYSYINKTHAVHVAYNNASEKFNFIKQLIDNEDVFYIADTPLHLEYLYSNLNYYFKYKFILILLIGSIISFLLIKRIQ